MKLQTFLGELVGLVLEDALGDPSIHLLLAGGLFTGIQAGLELHSGHEVHALGVLVGRLTGTDHTNEQTNNEQEHRQQIAPRHLAAPHRPFSTHIHCTLAAHARPLCLSGLEHTGCRWIWEQVRLAV